jgi:hypothetical protein
LIESFKSVDFNINTSLADSMPVIACGGRNRTGKAAAEITNKDIVQQKINTVMD